MIDELVVLLVVEVEAFFVEDEAAVVAIFVEVLEVLADDTDTDDCLLLLLEELVFTVLELVSFAVEVAAFLDELEVVFCVVETVILGVVDEVILFELDVAALTGVDFFVDFLVDTALREDVEDLTFFIWGSLLPPSKAPGARLDSARTKSDTPLT